MNRVTRHAAARVALVITLAACGGGHDEKSPTYTKRDESFTVEAGKRFEIRLVSNPSTGYEWKVSKLPARLLLVDERFEGSEEPRPGAGGHQVFEFQALRAGDATLELEYTRSFEPDAEPAQTATFDVAVG